MIKSWICLLLICFVTIIITTGEKSLNRGVRQSEGKGDEIAVDNKVNLRERRSNTKGKGVIKDGKKVEKTVRKKRKLTSVGRKNQKNIGTRKKSGPKRKSNGQPRAKTIVKRIPAPRQDTATCQSQDCLKDMLDVLRMNKDLVQNFLQQEARVQSRAKLMGKKLGKGNFSEGTRMLLGKSLGMYLDKKSAPICAGRYNQSKGIMGASILQNMSLCETEITAVCNYSLPTAN